jgi:uncharacterized membrane protein YhaH (DUF805 family)
MDPSFGLYETFSIVLCKNFANFKGRACRSEFWIYILFIMVMHILLFILGRTTNKLNMIKYQRSEEITVFDIINIIVLLIFIIPSLAVTVRRLHDIGKPGWYIFIVIIPGLGLLILFLILLQDSKAEPNQYGPSPKINSNLQNNDDQRLIDQNNPAKDNPQQQPPTYQQPDQNSVLQKPYQNPVPTESNN